MAPGIEFTLSLGHIPLITFTLRQWYFHFNDRLALPSYPASATLRREHRYLDLPPTPLPAPAPNGFHCHPLIEIRFVLYAEYNACAYPVIVGIKSPGAKTTREFNEEFSLQKLNRNSYDIHPSLTTVFLFLNMMINLSVKSFCPHS